MYGFASYFIGFAFLWIFSCLIDLQIPGTYINNTYYGDPNNITPTGRIFRKCAYVSFASGITMFLLAFEINVKLTKYLLSTVQIILTVLIIILPYNLANFIYTYVLFPYSEISLIFILFYFTKWSKHEFAAISSLLLFGVMLFGVGLALSSVTLRKLNAAPIYITPIFFILGALISISPTVINPKFYSQALIYWLIFGILTISIVCIIEIQFIYFFIFYELPVYYPVLTIFFILVLIYVQYNTIKIIRAQSTKSQELQEDKKLKNVLELFTRPQMFTEEEVTSYIEQKVCLVCKNKVSRFNIYICPVCDVLYCENCARTLTAMENACWVCETPFDESKPVKILREKEKAEDKIHKKRK